MGATQSSEISEERKGPAGPGPIGDEHDPRASEDEERAGGGGGGGSAAAPSRAAVATTALSRKQEEATIAHVLAHRLQTDGHPFVTVDSKQFAEPFKDVMTASEGDLRALFKTMDSWCRLKDGIFPKGTQLVQLERSVVLWMPNGWALVRINEHPGRQQHEELVIGVREGFFKNCLYAVAEVPMPEAASAVLEPRGEMKSPPTSSSSGVGGGVWLSASPSSSSGSRVSAPIPMAEGEVASPYYLFMWFKRFSVPDVPYDMVDALSEAEHAFVREGKITTQRFVASCERVLELQKTITSVRGFLSAFQNKFAAFSRDHAVKRRKAVERADEAAQAASKKKKDGEQRPMISSTAGIRSVTINCGPDGDRMALEALTQMAGGCREVVDDATDRGKTELVNVLIHKCLNTPVATEYVLAAFQMQLQAVNKG